MSSQGAAIDFSFMEGNTVAQSPSAESHFGRHWCRFCETQNSALQFHCDFAAASRSHAQTGRIGNCSFTLQIPPVVSLGRLIFE